MTDRLVIWAQFLASAAVIMALFGAGAMSPEYVGPIRRSTPEHQAKRLIKELVTEWKRAP